MKPQEARALEGRLGDRVLASSGDCQARMSLRSTCALARGLLARGFLAIAATWCAVGNATLVEAGMAERWNVLFIAVDDLRPELACYGHPVVKTPNIDRLAASGTLFRRAYCQQAVCNSSRASLMTGLRPDTTKVYDLPTHFRDKVPDVVTLSQYFMQHGYHAQRVGKIYHTSQGNRDDPLSWSVSESFQLAERYGPEGRKLLRTTKQQVRENPSLLRGKRVLGPPWEAPEVEDHELMDGTIARTGVELMRRHRDQPFFIAVGFMNPHLPFVSPKKYWDLYKPEDVQLANNPYPPKNAPRYAGTGWGELRNYHGMPKAGPLSEQQAREAVHGYWAAVSYIDAQVGLLLEELEQLELREKTVVILWGDHGWQLGEHGYWSKHTNYEVAARSPLIISIPGQSNPGGKSDALVEFVDVYPSLAEACSLPEPKGLDGISFLPLLENPDRSWKTAAFHQFPRGIPKVGQGMGRAIRTDRFRLVEWTVQGKDFREVELYDQRDDPDENVNLAGMPGHAETVRRLTEQLHAGWKAALPPDVPSLATSDSAQ